MFRVCGIYVCVCMWAGIRIEGFRPECLSLLYIMLEIHHSGREPSVYMYVYCIYIYVCMCAGLYKCMLVCMSTCKG